MISLISRNLCISSISLLNYDRPSLTLDLWKIDPSHGDVFPEAFFLLPKAIHLWQISALLFLVFTTDRQPSSSKLSTLRIKGNSFFILLFFNFPIFHAPPLCSPSSFLYAWMFAFSLWRLVIFLPILRGLGLCFSPLKRQTGWKLVVRCQKSNQ